MNSSNNTVRRIRLSEIMRCPAILRAIIPALICAGEYVEIHLLCV